MKRILRILMIAICCMVSCNMVANAGNDKPISVNALPAKAQTFADILQECRGLSMAYPPRL